MFDILSLRQAILLFLFRGSSPNSNPLLIGVTWALPWWVIPLCIATRGCWENHLKFGLKKFWKKPKVGEKAQKNRTQFFGRQQAGPQASTAHQSCGAQACC